MNRRAAFPFEPASDRLEAPRSDGAFRRGVGGLGPDAAGVASGPRSPHWRVVLRCLNPDWFDGSTHIFPVYEFPLAVAHAEEDAEQHAVDMARDEGRKPVSLVDVEIIEP